MVPWGFPMQQAAETQDAVLAAPFTTGPEDDGDEPECHRPLPQGREQSPGSAASTEAGSLAGFYFQELDGDSPEEAVPLPAPEEVAAAAALEAARRDVVTWGDLGEEGLLSPASRAAPTPASLRLPLMAPASASVVSFFTAEASPAHSWSAAGASPAHSSSAMAASPVHSTSAVASPMFATLPTYSPAAPLMLPAAAFQGAGTWLLMQPDVVLSPQASEVAFLSPAASASSTGTRRANRRRRRQGNA